MLSAYFAFGQDKPFHWYHTEDNGKLNIIVDVTSGHYLYQQHTELKVTNGNGKSLAPEITPETTTHQDDIFGDVDIYSLGKNLWQYNLDEQPLPITITVDYLGCRDRTATSPPVCFAPQTKTFAIDDGSPVSQQTKPPTVSRKPETELSNLLSQFNISRTAAGAMNSSEFLTFLHDTAWEQSPFAGKSMVFVILLIIVGGIGLNLTPCVLPLIPINLAVIGAGGATDNKRKGFIRGAAYGAGIALAYGGLGLAAVLLGSRFGSLNSSPWFNFAIATVFIVLGLAMFDVLFIDFSKYASTPTINSSRNRIIAIFVMGIVAALLAGACVAPVVIAVLLYSAKIYSEGNHLGLLLPFLLGFAMALPWPFAGAGVAIMPKPGAWMVRVKQFFGIIILLAAIYYAHLGYSLLPKQDKTLSPTTNQTEALTKGLKSALRDNKPVLIDFWATWCKNCVYMEATTFKEPQVKTALEKYVLIKFQAENMRDPTIKPILDYFQIQGLPSFVILSPKSSGPQLD